MSSQTSQVRQINQLANDSCKTPRLPEIHAKRNRSTRRMRQNTNLRHSNEMVKAAFSPQSKVDSGKRFSGRKSNVFSPVRESKRRSLQETVQPLSLDQQACVDMHVKLIAKSRRKVVEAKASRFKGFFSPRLLRKKAFNFTSSRIDRLINSDSASTKSSSSGIIHFAPTGIYESNQNRASQARFMRNADTLNQAKNAEVCRVGEVSRANSDDLSKKLTPLV